MPLIIKGKLIDVSNPTICIPIVEKSYEEIIDAATRLKLKHVEMVEWRADFYEDLFDKDALAKTLNTLKGILSNIVFVVTIRTVSEGGQVAMEEEDMEEILTAIANSRCADLIDVEYFQYSNPGNIIRIIQERGAGVIASHHDFSKTPSETVCLRILEEMKKVDPDILKLAFMPNSNKDVFTLGVAASAFNNDNPQYPLIIVSMSDLGVISRLAPSAFSSCVTFGSVDKSSAPGQIELSKLRELIEFTKEFYGK